MFNFITPYDQKILSFLYGLIKNLPIGFDKFFAEYLVYFIPVLLIVLWFYKNETKKLALRSFLSIVTGWFVLATPLGHLINRTRPFAGGGVQELLFHRPTYSFPSDHATAFFAFAFILYLFGQKKIASFVLVLAIINSLFRIATGIHWPSDILGGVILGLIAALVIKWLDKPLNYLYDFVIKIMKKVRLA